MSPALFWLFNIAPSVVASIVLTLLIVIVSFAFLLFVDFLLYLYERVRWSLLL